MPPNTNISILSINKRGVNSDCDNDQEGYYPYCSCPHSHTLSLTSSMELLQPSAGGSCPSSGCNPIKYSISDPNNRLWDGEVLAGIRIDGRGRDPYGLIKIVKTVTNPPTLSPIQKV
jgi:hypothetical protein